MARFRLPDGATSLSVGGQEYLPDAEACVVVDDGLRADCLRAGCVEVGEAPAETDEKAEGGKKRR